MKRIPLRRLDGSIRAHALVDDEDFERVSGMRWSVNGRGYVTGDWDGRREALHRVVMGLVPGDGLEVDHENRDRLDCTRGNLRVTTRAGNAQNTVARPGARSRFRGVSWFRARGYWRARYDRVTVGYHRDEVQAAVLIERWRQQHAPMAQPDPELVALGLA